MSINFCPSSFTHSRKNRSSWFSSVAVLALFSGIACAAPTINAPAVSPASIPLGTATAATFTASITDPSITTTGINLQRLDANGTTFSNIAIMYDDGTHGDATAGDGTFSVQLTLNEPSPFPVTFRVSAPVKGSLTRIFSSLIILNVSGGAPASITLTSPPNLAFVNTSPVTVSGSVSDPSATITVNGLPAPVSGNTFTVNVAVQEGNNILTASAKNAQGVISTASLQVTLDTTPPRISIDAPYDAFSTTDAAITVSGKVNDTVVGTVNPQQVAVTVNGIAATVANRGFQALNVPLTLGNNAIVVTARDRAGNGATSQITVRRDNPTQSIIKIISGNNQTGAVGVVLASPIVAGVVDGAGNPVSNQLIVFTVTQNNGTLDAAGTVEAVMTDSTGHAQARWKLGTRSGAGNNIVEATAVGFAGSAIFTASGTAGSPGMVSLDAGNDQTGAVTQPLPHPFIVVITDASHNRLANIPVTFQVKQGGGNFAAQASLTTNTDSDGRAGAVLTLGPNYGIENNVVEATFAGNTGFPAAFSASGRIPGNPAATKITGVVLDNSNNPVPGATIRAFLQNVPAQQSGGLPPNVSAVSDLQGQFTIQPAPVGYVKIIADGSTVTRAGKWPNLEYDLVTVSGQINTVGLPIYLLPLDTNHQLCVSDTQGGTLTLPAIPGFALSVLPGAATFPGGSKSGCVTVTAVHPDKIPMVPGFGQQPRFIVTIQPAGTLFNPPAMVTMPNAESLAPREVTEMYSFDHDLATFVSIGSATVSDDGTVLRSDPGVGVLKAGWYCGGPPTPAGSVGVCGECKMCNGSACVKDPLQDGNSCTTGGKPGVCSDAAGNCIPIQMKLEKVGDTIISTDGKYSEDTTIRVTAVRGDTGQTVPSFSGSVSLAEDTTAIYSQNGGTLPASVTLAAGTTTFLAKSLAGPKSTGTAGAKPDPAKIKTTNFVVYGGASLPVEQWVDLGQKHNKSSGAVFDWVEARAKDIFDNATGDLATVLSKVSSYVIGTPDAGGTTPRQAVATSQITINPYFVQQRLNTDGGDVCGSTRSKFFTNTVIHEARHAYQDYLSTVAGNDADADFLVNSVPVAPTGIIVDSTTSREVCNLTSNAAEMRAYKGDSTADTYLSPDFVQYAREHDAPKFAAAHQ